MVAQNLRRHEVVGLVYQFLGSTCLGIGLYYAVWAATRTLYYRSISTVRGAEWLIFPLLFGVGAVLWSLGKIELKEAQPGYGVRK